MEKIKEVLLLISAILLILCFIKTFLIKKPTAKNVRLLLTSVLFLHVGNFIFMTYPTVLGRSIAYSLYFITMDVALFLLLNFSIKYTRLNFKFMPLNVVFSALVILDCFSILINPIYHHVYVCTSKGISVSQGHLVMTTYWGFTYHLAVSLTLFIFSLGILFYKLFHTPIAYLQKYIFINICMLAAIAGDALHFFNNEHNSISLICYSICAILVFYFTLEYVPKRLLDGMLSQIVSNINSALVFCDIDHNYILLNNSAKKLFNIKSDDEYYKCQPLLKKWLNNPDLDTDLGDFTCFYNGEFDSKTMHLEIAYRNIYNANNIRVGSYYQIIDTTETIDTLEKERYLAKHDAVTGIYNKNHFYTLVRRQLEEFPQYRYLAVVVSINEFKLINDVFGPRIGDDVLFVTAAALKELHNNHKILYGRISSNKFGILIKKTDYHRDYIYELFDKVSKTYKKIYYPIVYHIGVFEISDDRIPIALMYDNAVHAIEDLHNNYKLQISNYSERLNRKLLWEREVISSINEAISNEELLLFLQPLINKDNAVVGAEVLVRWDHPIKGLLYPNQFIPILEKNGLIIQLDQYMWEHACALLSKWKKQNMKSQSGENMYLSLNISPMDFYFLDVHEEFIRLIKKYDLSPCDLRLEITETVLMHDIDRKIAIVQKLKDDGFIIEIDNFGTGYTTLNILHNLPIDVLKLDMSFLYETRNPDNSERILNDLIGLANQLGITIITEGIEVKEQITFLSKMGCSLFQGFYFSKPKPVDEFETNFLK
ncbi:diguanylate cyclase (GGDEF) domain-containing protein [Lachnospiraceae bacterium C7]|nr:diguanylate cyclase (GGDEF) domain-containing protein [Lachnospiraceae bacterium C7]